MAVLKEAVGTTEKPLRVAVVGSGPAGFYAAAHLQAATSLTVQVDMFDRLITPWGLVRAGVAPDHPKIKSVSRMFEKFAKRPGFSFHGNVELGRDIEHAELLQHYHAVLYAVGAANDRRLRIAGEDLSGCHAATQFVSWYNGHPDFADEQFDLSGTRAVVVGNGNVAIDVARILALSPAELEVTDIADHALEALRASNISEVVVLGRRGPAQAAFTTAELRELGSLADTDVIVDSAEAELDDLGQAWLADHGGDRARANVELLQEYSRRTPRGGHKRIVLRFQTVPVALIGEDRVEGMDIARTVLQAAGDGNIVSRTTAAQERLECGFVLRSIGYLGKPIPGVPFDADRATIHNDHGRVSDPATGQAIPGVYTAGWIKRGPSGVIGTNKKCAQETVDLLLHDVADGVLNTPLREPQQLLETLKERGVHVTDYAAWEAVDAHERGAGEPLGRPRVKLVRHPELIERARNTRD
jgi:ferredoxin--NADP+ reductase